MLIMKVQQFNNNWDVLVQFFPEGWEEQAMQLGALVRLRKIKSASQLLRLLLIHLVGGCSLREAVIRAEQGGLPKISDVALLKRLRASSEWLRWMATEFLKRRGLDIIPPSWLADYQVRTIDASIISEPGSTGTDWRLHYSIKLFGLQCDQFLISRPGVGESFVNFGVNKNDLLIGDAAYCGFKGLVHVFNQGGYFLVRFKNKAFTLLEEKENKKEFGMLVELKKLSYGEVGEWSLQATTGNSKNKLAIRVCAIKKSEEEAEKSLKNVLKAMRKKQRKINVETLELHRYVILLTSLPNKITGDRLMELYRSRWQIEVAFKRLKSILGLGHLHKIDEESAQAWLHGKLLVALLAQAIVDEGRFFSPWGYPLQTQTK
jgi:hypothetical protein